MKQFLIFLMLIPALIGQTQTLGLDAICMAYQAIDHGTGIRVDFHAGEARIYTSATYGYLGLYQQAGLKDHFKFSIGSRIPITTEPGQRDENSLTIGMNYHRVSPVSGTNNGKAINPAIMKDLSIELGGTVYYGRFAFGIRTDIMRWEPGLDVGIRIWQDKNNRR